MRYLILLLISMSLVNAKCYVINNLSGLTFNKQNEFKLSEDKFSHPFELIFDGDNSKVSNSDLKYIQFGLNTLIGLYSDKEGRATIENWVVYPSKKTVIYTKTISGYNNFDGGRLFKGHIIGKCK